jgi:hypothetical protein
MKKKGISLIVLVVTIIVIIILSGTVVLSLSNNNPIDSAKEANFKTSLQEYNSELALTLSSKYLQNNLFDPINLNLNKWDGTGNITGTIKEYVPSINAKYGDKFAIQNGKLIYVGHDSKENEWAVNITIESAMNIVLPDDIVNVQLKAFITEWTTTSANETITLPIYDSTGYVYNFDVNYGDGTIVQVTSATDTDRIHTYAVQGKYTVKIEGICNGFGFSTVVTSNTKITKLVQWGTIQAKAINFKDCSNLVGTIPIPSKNSFIVTTDFNRLFYNCVGLTGSIPKELFANAKEALDLAGAFAGTTGKDLNLTGSIPEYLLAQTSKVTSLAGLFQYCSKLTGSIPENLFSNNTKTTSCNATFAYCSGLTGSIPAVLFANTPNVTNFSGTFFCCSGLTGSIPDNLFANTPNVTTFNCTFAGYSTIVMNFTGSIPSNLFANNKIATIFSATFQDCEHLTGTIPSILFKNNTEAVMFDNVFRRCTLLTGVIPVNLFDTCTKAYSFSTAFINCYGLTGDPLPLWNKVIGGLYGTGCYSGCTGLNLLSTPTDWKVGS